MWRSLTTVACGLLFAIGLGISGMTQPGKVLAFLDVTGSWDPSLAMVMLGAVGVHLLAVRLHILPRGAPLWGGRFELPRMTGVDARLLTGAAIFGIGWGLGGMCPGPALTDLASLTWQPFVFVLAMLVGMVAVRVAGRRSQSESD